MNLTKNLPSNLLLTMTKLLWSRGIAGVTILTGHGMALKSTALPGNAGNTPWWPFVQLTNKTDGTISRIQIQDWKYDRLKYTCADLLLMAFPYSQAVPDSPPQLGAYTNCSNVNRLWPMFPDFSSLARRRGSSSRTKPPTSSCLSSTHLI